MQSDKWKMWTASDHRSCKLEQKEKPPGHKDAFMYHFLNNINQLDFWFSPVSIYHSPVLIALFTTIERGRQHIPLGDSEVLEKFKCFSPIRSLANWAPREEIPTAGEGKQKETMSLLSHWAAFSFFHWQPAWPQWLFTSKYKTTFIQQCMSSSNFFLSLKSSLF